MEKRFSWIAASDPVSLPRSPLVDDDYPYSRRTPRSKIDRNFSLKQKKFFRFSAFGRTNSNAAFTQLLRSRIDHYRRMEAENENVRRRSSMFVDEKCFLLFLVELRRNVSRKSVSKTSTDFSWLRNSSSVVRRRSRKKSLIFSRWISDKTITRRIRSAVFLPRPVVQNTESNCRATFSFRRNEVWQKNRFNFQPIEDLLIFDFIKEILQSSHRRPFSKAR